MKKEERFDYIFGNHKNGYVVNRFDWLDTALLSDIRSLIDGGEAFVNGDIEPILEGSHGAGNISISILVCVGMELAAALYTGQTKYNTRLNYDAPKNVKKFINRFFPNNSHCKRIAFLLWDGVRNGINHIFIPKLIKFPPSKVGFEFVVNRYPDKLSYASKYEDGILITINSIEFHHTLTKAIDEYGSELKKQDLLQRRFIKAWQSIENGEDQFSKRISPELKYLFRKLKHTEKINLFVAE
jgi:hypothetical protein